MHRFAHLLENCRVLSLVFTSSQKVKINETIKLTPLSIGSLENSQKVHEVSLISKSSLGDI